MQKANQLDSKATHGSALRTLLVGCGKLWSRGQGSVVKSMSWTRMQGLKLPYSGLEKVVHLEKGLVDEKVLLDGKGSCGSYLEM